jgi:hypothetical protein
MASPVRVCAGHGFAGFELGSTFCFEFCFEFCFPEGEFETEFETEFKINSIPMHGEAPQRERGRGGQSPACPGLRHDEDMHGEAEP